MKNYYEWLNISRGIGMFLVVCGHALADSFDIRGGGMLWAFEFIYSFHMPLFFFLSGFLSCKGIRNIGAHGKASYIKQRFSRLMIPYFAVALIYIPLNIIFSKFTSVKDEGNVALNLLCGINPDFQLWTLYTLFGCAVIICLLYFLSAKTIFFISLFLFCIGKRFELPIPIIEYILNNLLFYSSGFLFQDIYDSQIESKKNIFFSKMALLIALSFLVLSNFLRTGYGITIWGMDLLQGCTAFSGIYVVITLSVWISQTKSNRLEILNNKIWNLIGDYSMDIYIMGNLPQVLSRTIFSKAGLIPHWSAWLSSVIAGIIFPVLASKLLVRRKILLRRLILGMK